MFIAGVSGIAEPPVNDLWTIPGEAELLARFKAEDSALFSSVDMIHYHEQQLSDFLDAILSGRRPLITLEDGRRTVELITGIYRSRRDHRPIAFPLAPEHAGDMDGRLR